MIGATARHIRTPFLVEGAFLGGMSCALALSLSLGLFLALKDYLKDQISMLQLTQHIQFLSATPVALLMVFAISLGTFSAWICVRRINTGWAASQRMSGAQKA